MPVAPGLIGRKRARALSLAMLSLLAAGLASAPAEAQDATAPAPAAAAATDAAAPAQTTAAPADLFTQEELRKLLAPYALYPDALLAQLLPATAYPIDIVQAARWLDKNKSAVSKGDFSGADEQGWDASVKALVRFPDIIKKLNTDLEATADLGDAFVNQPDEVAAMIQTLRREAQKVGSLKSNKQQTVKVQPQNGTDYVVIEPTDPEVIYVPTYDPATVYYDSGATVATGLISFGLGVAVGAAINNTWDWGRGWVYPPRWPGYPGYRPGYRGDINIDRNIDRNVNIGNGNTIIGGGNNIGSGNMRPWRPDNDRYRPGQGSKPGIANRPGNRPAGERPIAGRPGERPGAGQRPAIGDRPGAGERPGIGERPGGGIGQGGIGERPGVADRAQRPAGGQGANRVDRDGGARNAAQNRPSAGGGNKVANRPATKNTGAKNTGAKKPAAKKPANRPAAANRANPTAFSGARMGGSSNYVGQRGAASRQQIHRPAGPRPSMNRGGGGGARMHGGGRGGGGGRRR